MTTFRIKQLANEAGISKKALAEKAGLTIGKIDGYWNNTVATPDKDRLARIAEALGVTPDHLVDPEEEKFTWGDGDITFSFS